MSEYQPGTVAVATVSREQTKPARIPEPGLWGVVEAAFSSTSPARFRLVHAAQGHRGWIVTEDGSLAGWGELVDPVLIREGLS